MNTLRGCKKKMHKRYIDYLRVVSMLAVVMIHICTTALTDFDDGAGNWKGVLFVSVINLLHFAVPVFFMISGALLLSPSKEITLERLLKRYVLKYAGVIAIFCWLFAFIEIVFDRHDIRPDYFLESFLNMLQGKTWAHMWYMYTLFGVMLLLPVLRWIVKEAGRKEIFYLTAMLGLFLSVLPFFESFSGFHLGVPFPVASVYMFHMLLGYWIDVGIIRWGNGISAIMIICCCVSLVAASYLDVMSGAETGVVGNYSSPIMIIFSAALFMLAKNTVCSGRIPSLRSQNRARGGVKDILSDCSFGVYIIHMFWINLAYKLFRINPFVPNVFVMMILLWLAVVALSVLAAVIMKRVPLINKIV